MLRMAGVQLHPGVRVLIGAALIALALIRHAGPAPLLIGGALILWGLAASVAQPRHQ
jgi:hypothetical protein